MAEQNPFGLMTAEVNKLGTVMSKGIVEVSKGQVRYWGQYKYIQYITYIYIH